jgi:hypothetical protein
MGQIEKKRVSAVQFDRAQALNNMLQSRFKEIQNFERFMQGTISDGSNQVYTANHRNEELLFKTGRDALGRNPIGQ